LAFFSTACGDFEVRSVVLDLRVLGMNVSPPEVIVPANLDEVDIGDIPDVEVCALIADPSERRRLTWTMEACAPTDSRRCDEPEETVIFLGERTVEDPEEVYAPAALCDRLLPSGDLVAVVFESVQNDPLSGFGGAEVMISFRVGPEGGNEDEFVYASKSMFYAPKIPDERVANKNPYLVGVTGLREPGIRGREFEVPLGRCADITPFEVLPGEKIGLLPVEPAGVREDYVVPTFDGDVRNLTENMRYSWYATDGDWTREVTGGPKDFVGNQPPIDTKWEAPPSEDVPAEGLDVPLWLVQQDERGGVAWYESCVHVPGD
jgi:hypothetical protein